MENISIELTKDKALVLFEFLSKFSDDDNLKINDKSEEVVLWNILASLEKILVEPFDKNYLTLLKESQNRIKLDNGF